MTDISASQALGAFAKGMSNVSDEWSEYNEDMQNMDPEDNVLLEVFGSDLFVFMFTINPCICICGSVSSLPLWVFVATG